MKAVDKFVAAYNAAHPGGPKAVATENGFTTAPYCQTLENGVRVHVGHEPDQPCKSGEMNDDPDS